MRILFVCSGLSVDYISPVVAAQGRSLERAGVSVDYFPIGGRGLLSYIRAIFSLRRLLAKSSYDCVHAHYGLSGIIAVLAGRRQKRVISFMGSDILGSRDTKGRTTVFSKVLTEVNVYLSSRFFNHTIVKSEGMLHPRLKRQSVTVIPNGVDTDLFRPLARSEALEVTGWDPEIKHLVFASNPQRHEKNFRLAQKSVECLGRRDIELHAVNGKEHGFMPFAYNSADALLLTSFHEGSANAIKEAMACNCPVISTETGDAAWVTANVEGCFIVPFDPLPVSRGIENAVAFRAGRGQTEGRARIYALNLDSVHVAARIISIYRKISE